MIYLCADCSFNKRE